MVFWAYEVVRLPTHWPLTKTMVWSKKVRLTRFTLHVVGGVFEFYVSIEAEDGHGEAFQILNFKFEI